MRARLDVRLRDWRTRAGLTQAELADMAGVSRKTINTVENGVFIPSTALALGLAHILGCTVEDLFSLQRIGRDSLSSPDPSLIPVARPTD